MIRIKNLTSTNGVNISLYFYIVKTLLTKYEDFMNSNLPKLILIWEDEKKLGLNNKVILLDKPVISIGRKKGNNIVIQDRTLSGHHADIVISESAEGIKYLLIDNNSTNKTFVNDTPILEKELHNQDLIRFGKIEFLFSTEDSQNKISSTNIINNSCNTSNEIKKINIISIKEQKLRFLLLTLLTVFIGAIVILIIFAFVMLTHIPVI